MNANDFTRHLQLLRLARQLAKAGARKSPRRRLNQTDRAQILRKTGGKCHICGGAVEGKWQADHVSAHSRGGHSSTENYLPAHAICNNYRWDYSAEEFQFILKLGVWLRTKIEKESALGKAAARQFSKSERTRIARRKTTTWR